MDVGASVSCREFFKILNILPLISQFIFLLTLFVVTNNIHQFKMNSAIHGINPRNKLNFYQPSYQSVFHKGPYYMGIKLYTGLPAHMKDLTNNIKQFEYSLLGFLHLLTFYTVEEYFNQQHN